MGVPFQLKSSVALDKQQVNAQRKAWAGWDAYTTGNAYVVYFRNRTIDHGGRGYAYGKTPADAVKRWYRGLDGSDKWKRQCVKVVAVYTCADTQTGQAGDLLVGQAQDSAPW